MIPIVIYYIIYDYICSKFMIPSVIYYIQLYLQGFHDTHCYYTHIHNSKHNYYIV